MIRGLYTAVSGMITLEAKQDVVTNNMANAGNNGYKADNLVVKSFDDVLIQNKDKLVGNKNVTNDIGRLSLGSRIDTTTTDYKQGIIQDTGKECDFAMEGKGFFVVQRGNETLYTRDGHFRVNSQGYLVNELGDEVLGNYGGSLSPINVGNNKMQLDAYNNLHIEGGQTVKLATADFDDYNTLEKIGDNLYRGGNANLNADVNIKQGALEKSNVNLINEMVNMMNVMRSFETNQKMVQVMDETMGKAANEIGAVK